MSRRTRNPFTKVSNFFKQRSDPSRSSNANALSTGPQVLAPPSPPPRTPSPTISRPPPSTAQAPTSSIIPSPTPSSLEPPSRRPEDYEIVSSHVAASSTSSDALPQPPPNLTLRPPTPRQIPFSPLPLASRTPTPQFGEPPSFAGAHGFSLYNPQFVDNSISLGRPGLMELLKHSMPDAFHNSAARYPPPKCHLGTRNDYIAKIMDWAHGNSDHDEPILWMRGPFGIGKSAVAQSCAEAFQLQDKLVATLFFSRSNTDRDDPRRVFTSIAYQIATLSEAFSDITNTRICKDPALATKSLSTQFEELLVYPLTKIDIASSGMKGRVVIIDGLDECRGTSEQCEIIRVIAASARERTTPFRWFITSRPEDPIIRTMNSPTVSSVSLHLELPVSRKIDHEILLYLTDEFKKIRESHGLADSWPSEDVFALLVDRTAGLWIYVTTITRFIIDENSLGPEDQLRIVLAFLKDVSAKVGPDNPLMEMDFFYILIMQRVPPKIRTIVRKILLLNSFTQFLTGYVAGVLGLPDEQFRRSCASIQSVMQVQGSGLGEIFLHFHHASFLDFMTDPKRSKELCVRGSFLIEYRLELLDWLHQVCSRSTGPSHLTFPSEPVLVEGWDYDTYYAAILRCFWQLCGAPDHPFDLRAAASLETLHFRMMLQLMGVNERITWSSELKNFQDNLPTEYRNKIFRQAKCPTPGCTYTGTVWILGHGENETVAVCISGDLILKNNQDPHPGSCFCGSPIETGGSSGLGKCNV